MNSSLLQNRDTLRAGWLRYIPFAEKSSSIEHKFWAIFVVYDTTRPYLEFYQKRQAVNNNGPTDDPVSKHSLLNCRHISSVISPNESHYFEFTITLDTYVIRLAAENAEAMYDWINCLKTQLISMNILNSPENVYSKCPSEQPLIAFDSQTSTSSNQIYEPIFSTVAQSLQQLSLGTSTQFVPAEEGPPPYEHIFAQTSTNNATPNSHPVSFREAQVFKLRKEMEIVPGLNLKVRKKDCYHSIAFVDIYPHGIYVAGWKQKEHPYLHSTFHIGDKLVNINGIVMETAIQARNYIKQCSHTLELTVRRVPFGQVFCLKRSFDGEDLGILREKSTPEIKFVLSNSVAANAGLSSNCTYYQDEECREQNWCLTEINNRPLNLFFKNNEVADRLNAIGKEISILVHPQSFVRRLRKQLKTYKNYKDYIVQ